MINVAALCLDGDAGDASADVPDDSNSEVLRLEILDDICLKVTAKHCTITLDPRLPTDKPDMAVGYLGLEGAIELVWDSERFNARDTASSVAERKGVDALTKSLFVVGFEGENIHFITRKPIRSVPQGASHTAITVDSLDFLRPRQWVALQHASLQALVVKHKAKRSLMAKIKPLDSLAALEKQVDLLSELLIALAAGMDPTQRPAWLDDFAAGVKKASANQFVGNPAAVAEVIAYKNTMRALQTAYLAQRSETI
jgi:hypothetical protein